MSTAEPERCPFSPTKSEFLTTKLEKRATKWRVFSLVSQVSALTPQNALRWHFAGTPVQLLQMALDKQPYKGARDFYPEDKRLQKYIFNKWREVAERYGYEEYDAPLIELLELYKAKTGDEIVNEQTFAFKDRGGRDVTIRPEMTPSVSRLVAAKRQELAYPLRWYSIPNVWRYERPQKGRLREHWQLNVDVFGLEGVEAELEVIQVADEIMRTFGANPSQYVIKLNSRKLTDWLFGTHLKLGQEKAKELAKLLDRRTKMEETDFSKQLNETVSAENVKAVEKLFGLKIVQDLPEGAPAESLVKLMELLHEHDIKNAQFDIGLMRGFDYYNDIVFEVYDNDPENNRSIFGGGRYDGLVGLFGVAPLESVGFGLGEVTLIDFLTTHKLLPSLKTETDIFVVPIGDSFEMSLKIVTQLRQNRLNVAVGNPAHKADKHLKNAVNKGVPFALFIGEKELKSGNYSLKNLDTHSEQNLSLDAVISAVKGAKGDSN